MARSSRQKKKRQKHAQRPAGRRHRQVVQLEVGVVDPVGHGDHGQHQDHPQHRGHPIGERADHEEHDAFRPLHEADLALLDQRLGAGPRVAGHDREDQGRGRDQDVALAAERRVEPDQAGEERQIGKAIERRVPEGAELRLLAGDVRDLAVDEVEDVRADHDHAGEDEAVHGQRPGRPDVDQHPDQGEDVGMDAERDAGVDDDAQREHAGGADDPGERHVGSRIERRNRVENRL